MPPLATGRVPVTPVVRLTLVMVLLVALIVLFVTVCVLVAVKTLDGVMMFESIAMCYSNCVGAKTKKLMPMFPRLCYCLMC